ncbi:hypothetical protein [Methylococcus geothermalis]|uniref:Uncharacterized protein n=1 Tax=Methylococcus geothermalis TaxID=2681310 RepID=A0A858Q7D7_9GAMM|nr:hypothetical protein [Methylococcus geothermalis]QJD29704.1 hypothetical protein GNH96_06805 [Methylococcus geothermalis]
MGRTRASNEIITPSGIALQTEAPSAAFTLNFVCRHQRHIPARVHHLNEIQPGELLAATDDRSSAPSFFGAVKPLSKQVVSKKQSQAA